MKSAAGKKSNPSPFTENSKRKFAGQLDFLRRFEYTIDEPEGSV